MTVVNSSTRGRIWIPTPLFLYGHCSGGSVSRRNPCGISHRLGASQKRRYTDLGGFMAAVPKSTQYPLAPLNASEAELTRVCRSLRLLSSETASDRVCLLPAPTGIGQIEFVLLTLSCHRMKRIAQFGVIGFMVAFYVACAESQTLTNCTEIVLFKSMADRSDGSHLFKVSLQMAKRTYLIGSGQYFDGFKIVKYEQIPNTNKMAHVPFIRTLTMQRADKTFVVTLGDPYCLRESSETEPAQQGHVSNRSRLRGSR
jgi:hypothetical protein